MPQYPHQPRSVPANLAAMRDHFTHAAAAKPIELMMEVIRSHDA
jgi:hypothetical protein